MRQSRGQTTDAGQSIAAHHLVARFTESRGGLGELFDFSAQRFFLTDQPRGHGLHGAPQLDQLARSASRYIEPPRSRSNTFAGQDEAIERLHDQARHRYVQKYKKCQREQRHVQRDEMRHRVGIGYWRRRTKTYARATGIASDKRGEPAVGIGRKSRIGVQMNGFRPGANVGQTGAVGIEHTQAVDHAGGSGDEATQRRIVSVSAHASLPVVSASVMLV